MVRSSLRGEQVESRHPVVLCAVGGEVDHACDAPDAGGPDAGGWYCGFCAAEPKETRNPQKTIVLAMPKMAKDSNIQEHLPIHQKQL